MVHILLRSCATIVSFLFAHVCSRNHILTSFCRLYQDICFILSKEYQQNLPLLKKTKGRRQYPLANCSLHPAYPEDNFISVNRAPPPPWTAARLPTACVCLHTHIHTAGTKCSTSVRLPGCFRPFAIAMGPYPYISLHFQLIARFGIGC